MSEPANIAEGFGRQPRKRRFMNIAEGSMEESRYYLIPGPGSARKAKMLQ